MLVGGFVTFGYSQANGFVLFQVSMLRYANRLLAVDLYLANVSLQADKIVASIFSSTFLPESK